MGGSELAPSMRRRKTGPRIPRSAPGFRRRVVGRRARRSRRNHERVVKQGGGGWSFRRALSVDPIKIGGERLGSGRRSHPWFVVLELRLVIMDGWSQSTSHEVLLFLWAFYFFRLCVCG